MFAERTNTENNVIDKAMAGYSDAVAPGLYPAAVQARTDAPLRVTAECREMELPTAWSGVPLRV